MIQGLCFIELISNILRLGNTTIFKNNTIIFDTSLLRNIQQIFKRIKKFISNRTAYKDKSPSNRISQSPPTNPLWRVVDGTGTTTTSYSYCSAPPCACASTPQRSIVHHYCTYMHTHWPVQLYLSGQQWFYAASHHQSLGLRLLLHSYFYTRDIKELKIQWASTPTHKKLTHHQSHQPNHHHIDIDQGMHLPYEFCINIHTSYIIHNASNFKICILQNIPQQRRFPSSQESTEHGHRD